MTNSSASFAEAIRQALAESESIDMRSIATRVASGLPSEMVLEAAISHLATMARRYYNQELRQAGLPQASSDELVNLRGVDTRIRDTSDEDRGWLARNRESLADGLRASAQRLRDGAGFIKDQTLLSASDVLRAERRSARLQIAGTTLEHLIDNADTVSADRVATANARRIRYQAEADQFSGLAARVLASWSPALLRISQWKRTVHAVEKLQEAAA